MQIYSTTVTAVVAVVAAHAPTAQRNVKMKITKSQLKQIILEEIDLIEAEEGEEIVAAIEDVPTKAEEMAEQIASEIEALSEPSGLDPAVLAQAVAALLKAKVES